MKCVQCGAEHNRRKFCSIKCKDKWHNRHNPRGSRAAVNIDRTVDRANDLASYSRDWI